MKKFLSLIFIAILTTGCSSTETEEPKDVEVKKEEEVTKEEPKEEVVEEVTEEEKEEPKEEPKEEVIENEPQISTSVFQYAKDVEVTDARDITQHITVTVFMSEDLKEGLAAQHVLSQTYDFLQQEDIQGAETLTVGVMHGDNRVLQYTVDIAKFVPVDSEPMVDVVLAASKVEKITPEVEEFAEIFEWKMNK